MAVIEKDGLYQYIDESGNIYILYPVTKLDNVSGTGKLVHLENGTTLKTLDGTNIALVTAADLEALSNTANADTRVEYVDNVLKTLGGTEIVTGNARIATGSYVGTGTYGTSSKSSLTFDFVPELVIVMYYRDQRPINNGFIWTGQEGTASYCSAFSLSDKTLSWYSNSGEEYQHNEKGIEYYYVAIG